MNTIEDEEMRIAAEIALTVPKLTKAQREALEGGARSPSGMVWPSMRGLARVKVLTSLEGLGLIICQGGGMPTITDAGRAALKDEACKACAVRASRGFEGQCPACASERTRNERAALKDGAK